MATHTISMMTNVNPDISGRAWFEPLDVAASNDVWRSMIARFKDPTSQQHGIYGHFTVPNNYVGSAAVLVVWSSTATSGNCIWRLTYRAVGGDNAESLDQTSNQQQASVTDAAPGAAWRRLAATIAVTAANFAAGDLVEWLLERDGVASDTMAADAYLFDLLFSYADA